MQSKTFQTMTTEAHISFVPEAGAGLRPEEIMRRVEEGIGEVVRLMGPQSPGGDIKRLNGSRPGRWVKVDARTWRVVAEARLWHELSRGAFDPTIGIIKKLFVFDRGLLARWPSELETGRAAEGLGFDKIGMRSDDMSLCLTVPGQRLDLGAIAKGYALDRAAEILIENGIKNGVVEIGGEVKVLGLHPGPPPRPWRVGVEDPRFGGRSKFVLEMSNSAVASSGGLHRYFLYQGRSYSHIIDPRSCRPLENNILGVTAAHPRSCMTADALGTALSGSGA